MAYLMSFKPISSRNVHVFSLSDDQRCR